MAGRDKAKDAAYRKQRRADLILEINEIKKNLKCVKCGEKHIATLDFHHKGNYKKDFSISKAIRDRLSIITVKKEMLKCKVLCSNCHRILHHNQRQKDKEKVK